MLLQQAQCWNREQVITNFMLHRRQLIPPLTLTDAHGCTIRAWDFKQKKNLVIAFLDFDCVLCEEFTYALIECAAQIQEREAVVLLAFPRPPASSLTKSLPSEFIAGVDAARQGAQAFLGEDGLPTQEGRKRGVFVTDRYGEIAAQWIFPGHEFPAIGEALSALTAVEIACEECSVPDWPVDE